LKLTQKSKSFIWAEASTMVNRTPHSTMTPLLKVAGLSVYYGASHALQGVDLELQSGVLSVVGRNGMGKTTLCQAIMGLVPVSAGTISIAGTVIHDKTPADIAGLGVGYVPQGRRLWPSLTVDEHLKMVTPSTDGAWTVERIYSAFPRLAERRGNGGAQLSGGEQQMLAISRALLQNPRLLVMDEPTEGLAPVIVAQVADMLMQLAADEGLNVLVIEQNIAVATAVSEHVAIMVNGRINRVMAATALAEDRELQQSLLGVGRHSDDAEISLLADSVSAEKSNPEEHQGPRRIYVSNPSLPTRWSKPAPVRLILNTGRFETAAPSTSLGTTALAPLSLSSHGTDAVLVAGTLDTKAIELRYLRDILINQGLHVRMVDLSTAGKPSAADIPAHQIAAFHPRGAAAVFTSDRGSAVAGMTLAFERWIKNQSGIAGVIGAGGSGGTALLAPAFRSLPIGVPKLIISTIASGQVSQYVGPSDMVMMHAVADVQGLNSITRQILANGANAVAGMVSARKQRQQTPGPANTDCLPAIGLSMFGVTTDCIQQVTAALDKDYDCLVFHATGIGGQAMEKLVDEGLLTGVIDITTTEICDMMMGGVFPATEDRFGAIIRAGLPYIGSCGALDMVNFGAPESVPAHFQGRNLYQHNSQITLMRTTAEENDRMGRWIGERLNRMVGPVKFYLPEGGVSRLDAPGQPFHDPVANRALFYALQQTVRQTASRQLIHLPFNINDPAFCVEVIRGFRGQHGQARGNRYPAKGQV
jgi:uncharacterized protein (UPF0261 family)/ABC-type branched-subunit amino acid transport system ATPase component